MLAPQAEPQQKLQLRGWRSGLWLAGIVVVISIGSTLASFHHAPGDQPMTKADEQARVVAFQQAGPLAPALVTQDERAQALESMNLTAQPAEERQAIRDGREPLIWLTLWDDRYEDGDTVEILSHGFSQVVKLTNAPQRIAVPVPEGDVINVRGIYDGGGGITVAIRTGKGQVALPVMAVGQVIGVPLQAGL